MISTVQQQLKEARSEIDGTHFEDIWSHAQNTCQLCDIEAACDQSTDLATSGFQQTELTVKKVHVVLVEFGVCLPDLLIRS